MELTSAGGSLCVGRKAQGGEANPGRYLSTALYQACSCFIRAYDTGRYAMRGYLQVDWGRWWP